MSELSAGELAHYIDHTLLAPDAVPSQVAALVDEAVELGVFAICVSPSMLPLATKVGPVSLGDVKVATVVGFPSGKHTLKVKAFEAHQAVQHGADEIDMVLDIGQIHMGNRDLLAAQVAAVRAEVPQPKLVKVIIESAALSDDEIKLACQAAVGGGADFVKTSTGFHPAGGASVHAVELMRAVVGPSLGVKASGGIRDYATAVAMVSAGATRIGCSASRVILAGAPR
ncbi:MAG: deoxyribose-phosphate aldolase [Propionibacteriaceae bacterium]|nr:deoxyribose-phosphate aldolase [Propionibacteriaceae bacterium]